MKLLKLYLSAFGPFTDKLLDFTASPARVHLLFGPNEAGKSSALRAMTDLRFGIPARSTDNFVHDSPKLLLTAVLEDASGQPVAIARRKKNKDALTAADLGTRLPLATPVSVAIIQALTGGMDRAAFERSFGLDHARLREGGKELLKGEGELGAALFEASAGLQGIKSLLTSLQDDAKAYYSPRATQAVIPEALRQIEEHKAAFKAALIRPAEWKDRQRAVDTATDQLIVLQEQLMVQRKRIHTLTELRAVLPLLQQLTQVEYALKAQITVHLLPLDARERRQAAQHSLLTATEQLDTAQAEQAACAQVQLALVLEPDFVAHAPAIQRVVQACALVRQQRSDQLQLQTQAGQGAAALADTARRIHADAGLEAVLAAVPGPAERVALDELLDHIARHTQVLAQQQERLAQLDTQLSQSPHTTAASIAPALLAAVDTALQQALAVGDTSQRQAEAQRDMDAVDQRLQRALADLRLPTTAALLAARPLLPADIALAEKAQTDHTTQAEALRKEDADLQRELSTQQRRQQQLAAVGEVVTAHSLHAARQQRQTRWHAIKSTYGSDPTTLAAFEPAQTEADRQADLLREGAERAAQAADSALRIAEASNRRSAIALLLADASAHAAQHQTDWLQSLATAGLPPHPPAALREWQALRAVAVELYDRHRQLEREQTDAAHAVHTRTAVLAHALLAAGYSNAAPAELETLLPQASTWLRTAQDTAVQARADAQARDAQRAEHTIVQSHIATHHATLATALAAQTIWTNRLYLPTGSSPAAIKARLTELAALDVAHAAHTVRAEAIAQHQARADNVHAQVHALAALLGELAALQQMDDFADRLSARLARAQAHALQASDVARRMAAAQQQDTAAQQRIAASHASLQALCTAAGVENPAALPEAEDRSSSLRALQDKAHELDTQLHLATVRPLADLRSDLAGRDGVDTDTERAAVDAQVVQLEADIGLASAAAHTARQALAAIDTSAAAADAREQMESAVARLRAAVQPWMQLRLADSLLQEALARFRERAQAPMVRLASEYFGLITGGRYPKLVVDASAERPVLQAEGTDGRVIGIDAMSEGTADQLYLALRLAALELQRDNGNALVMPLVLDDVLMTSDDTRACHIFQALARFAQGGQVLLFTHHQHLVQVGQAALPDGGLAVHHL